jgi:hypothetical protein
MLTDENENNSSFRNDELRVIDPEISGTYYSIMEQLKDNPEQAERIMAIASLAAWLGESFVGMSLHKGFDPVVTLKRAILLSNVKGVPHLSEQ